MAAILFIALGAAYLTRALLGSDADHPAIMAVMFVLLTASGYAELAVQRGLIRAKIRSMAEGW